MELEEIYFKVYELNKHKLSDRTPPMSSTLYIFYQDCLRIAKIIHKNQHNILNKPIPAAIEPIVCKFRCGHRKRGTYTKTIETVTGKYYCKCSNGLCAHIPSYRGSDTKREAVQHWNNQMIAFMKFYKNLTPVKE